MDKQDNPYLNLLQIMSNQQPISQPSFVIGKIINNDPLIVAINDNIQLNREDMFINELLLKEAFDIGDKVVLLISEDHQNFILLAKVV